MNALLLKILACAAMFMDHLAVTLRVSRPVYLATGLGRILGAQSHYVLLTSIGRIAFPIFAFQLVEGVRYTSNKGKYLIRMGILALVSEVFFDLALYGKFFHWNHQNVFFTLLLGLIVIIVIDWSGRLKGKHRLIGSGIALAVVAIAATTAHVLCTDYGYKGVLTIAVLGLMTLPEYTRLTYPKSLFARTIICALAFTLLSVLCIKKSGTGEFYSLFALFPIFLYNGKKGYNKPLQYAVYAFYPVHLMLLGVVFVLPHLLR